MEANVNDTNFEKEVLKSDIPVLVDFWSPWCMPCHMVAPVVAKIAGEYHGRLKVCKVNVDEAPEAASRYGIMSIPTLAVFKSGEVVGKTVGAIPKQELEAVIEPHI